jgi:predicted flap endonuclease-1-like 5' DNA nuclease
MTTTDAGGHQAHDGDLDKLKGIGPRYRAILEEIGVASIKELRHRNAASLKAMIEKRHGAVVGLSEHQMQVWIDEAKAFTESQPA